MKKSLYTLTFSVLVLLAGSTSTAYAADTAAALARMDAIIAQMQALRAEFASLMQTTQSTVSTTQAPAVLGASASTIFTQSLEVGATNSDIERIQKLLATDKEIYGHGVVSGFFGPKTQEAIKNLQTRFGLKPVGEIGPATKALLESFFTAYPDGIYPEGVLLKRPTVIAPVVPQQSTTAVVTTPVPTATAVSGKAISSLLAVYDGTTAKVTVKYGDGTTANLKITADSKIKVIDAVATQLGQKKATVLSLIEFSSSASSANSDSSSGNGGDLADEVDSITASVKDGEARIRVRYSNGDNDKKFTVEETKETKIITEVADELDADESDVSDLIEFNYEPISTITVTIKDGSAIAFVTFEDGTEKRIKVASDNENTITKEVASELGESKSDIADIIEF